MEEKTSAAQTKAGQVPEGPSPKGDTGTAPTAQGATGKPTSRRRGYKTEQRQLVVTCLDENSDRYQTVDEVFAKLHGSGANIGRTTVYRTLEKLADEGTVSKVVGAPGTSALYKRLSDADQGQLLCLRCGRVFPLDCSMLSSFAHHVREHHGFAIDQRRTVICGVCEQCRRAEESPEGDAHDEHEHDCNDQESCHED